MLHLGTLLEPIPTPNASCRALVPGAAPSDGRGPPRSREDVAGPPKKGAELGPFAWAPHPQEEPVWGKPKPGVAVGYGNVEILWDMWEKGTSAAQVGSSLRPAKPLFPRPGDVGTRFWSRAALGTQTLQPKPVPGQQQRVSTACRGHLGPRGRFGGLVSPPATQPDVWEPFGAVVLMVFPPPPGPRCPHGPRAGGSPGLGSGVGRELSPGRTSATSTWMGPHASDPPELGLFNPVLAQFWQVENTELCSAPCGCPLGVGMGLLGSPFSPVGRILLVPPVLCSLYIF